jgi:quercetin dioxygenase-like cupin family protein
MSYTVVNRSELQDSEFEGYLHGDTNVSFLWVDAKPGQGPRLHRHPYEEVFIILEGCSTFTVGAETLEATAGQIVIVSPNTPHKFINASDQLLRQIDIHASKQFITEWLED